MIKLLSRQTPRAEGGFTMTEFVVGMALSGLALGLLVSVQLRLQQSMKQQVDQSKAMKSSSQALSLISQIVRSAGEGFPLGVVRRDTVRSTYGHDVPTRLGSGPAVRMNHYTATGPGDEQNAENLVFGRYSASQGLSFGSPTFPVVYPIEVVNQVPFGKPVTSGFAGAPDQIMISRGVGPSGAANFTSGSLMLNSEEFLAGGDTGSQLVMVVAEGVAANPNDDVGCVVGVDLPPAGTALPVSVTVPMMGTANNMMMNLCQGIQGAVRIQRFQSTIIGVRVTIDDCLHVKGNARTKGYLMRADLGVEVIGSAANFRIDTTTGRGSIANLGAGYSNLQIALHVKDEYIPGAQLEPIQGLNYSVVRNAASCPRPTPASPGHYWYSGQNMWSPNDTRRMTYTVTTSNTFITIDPTCPVVAGAPEVADSGVVKAVSLSLESRAIVPKDSGIASCPDGVAALSTPTTSIPPLCEGTDAAFNSIGDAPMPSDCETGVEFTSTGEPQTAALSLLYFGDATYSTTRVVVPIANAE